MADDIESQIKSAILSRTSYFKDQADSLTFEKVRRLLEKDLGLETHALDTHKRFVKQWLQTSIESASPDNLSKSQAEAEGKAVSSTEEPQSLDEGQVKNEVQEPNSGDAEPMEDSPVMGLMTGLKKSNTNDGEAINKPVLTEITIKEAIWARASYIRENSESITLAGLRRLLEEDLSTETHALDPFKKFISNQVDEVLNSPEAPETIVSEKKKNPKDSHRKVSSKSSKETPASSGNESDEVEEEEVRNKKRSAVKKQQKSAAVKKRQRTEESSNGAKRKQSKVSKSRSNNSSDEEGRDASEDDNSDASEKPGKKKEIPKPSYGKEVERLKSVIKSCGMSISPAVYRKVKQAPENKREACLIKELEEMLSKEGLSKNPSEKEIKDVKKMKERAKELEGIDLSNIVSSSRRRSTASFIPPPKPKIPDLSESESEESENDDEDDDEDDDEEGEEEVENEEVDEDQENGGNSSQSEESDKGNSESD